MYISRYVYLVGEQKNKIIKCLLFCFAKKLTNYYFFEFVYITKQTLYARVSVGLLIIIIRPKGTT